jgi:hypothetical protein
MADYRRHHDPAARLAELRSGKNHSSKCVLMVVPRRTPEVMDAFGRHFMVVEEGQGLYSHTFYRVFATVTPNVLRYGFWWNEVKARSDDKCIFFT